MLALLGAATRDPEQFRSWLARRVDGMPDSVDALVALVEADHEDALTENDSMLPAWMTETEDSNPTPAHLVIEGEARAVRSLHQLPTFGWALGACLHAGCHPGRCVYGPGR